MDILSTWRAVRPWTMHSEWTSTSAHTGVFAVGDLVETGAGNAVLFTLIGTIIVTLLGSITTIVVALINRKPVHHEIEQGPDQAYVDYLETRLAELNSRESQCEHGH